MGFLEIIITQLIIWFFILVILFSLEKYRYNKWKKTIKVGDKLYISYDESGQDMSYSVEVTMIFADFISYRIEIDEYDSYKMRTSMREFYKEFIEK